MARKSALLLVVLALSAIGWWAITRPGPTEVPRARAVLQGRVLSGSDGRPLAGATVVVRDWFDVVGQRGFHDEAPEPLHVITTDGDGRFVVPVMDRIDRPVVSLRAPGHASLTWRTDSFSPGGPVPHREVTLAPAGRLAGRVVDARGRPVPKALVYAVEAEAPDSEYDAPDVVWGRGRYRAAVAYRYSVAETDADGRFELDDVQRGRPYFVLAASVDLGPAAVQRPGSDSGDLEIRLPSLATVRVRVRTRSGKPVVVREGKIRATPRPTHWVVRGPGDYDLWPLAPGSHVLELDSETHAELRHDFTIPPGALRHEIEVTVEDGNTVSGVVVDDAGQPVAGATVHVHVVDPVALELRTTKVRTDARGRFASGGHPAGPVHIYAVREGFQTAELEDLPQPVRGIEIRLRRARDVPLRVQCPAGAPRPRRLEVAARALDDGDWIRGNASWDDGEPVLLEGVPVGRTALRLWAPGFALFEREVTVPGEGPISLEPAQLALVPTVTVRIVDEEGRPVPGAKVHAEVGELPPVNWTRIEKTTGNDGLAVLEIHREGPVSVYIEKTDGRQRVRRPIPEGSTGPVDVLVGRRAR